jgi:predicted DNA-binding protein
MTSAAFNARTADKFVVRMPDGMRSRVEQLAASQHTSMNTEIIRAIEAHLNGQARQKLLLDALEERLTQITEHTLRSGSADENEVDYLDNLKTGTL